MAQGMIEDRSVCTRCHQTITLYGGLWWSTDDDTMCPDGEASHTPGNRQDNATE